jgi:hypothetical protein
MRENSALQFSLLILSPINFESRCNIIGKSQKCGWLVHKANQRGFGKLQNVERRK